MPNKKAIQAWIDDLRSGKYKQGRGQLRDGDRFCCLGVACETYRRVTGRGEWKGKSFFVDGWCDVYTLPQPVSEWLGFDGDDNPPLAFPSGPLYCSEANDEHKKRFATIAKAVEATFLTED